MPAAGNELHSSRKHSVYFGNKRTSISLEDSFWQSLNAIVQAENISVGSFIGQIPKKNMTPNLSSSIRVAVLDYYKRRLESLGELPPTHREPVKVRLRPRVPQREDGALRQSYVLSALLAPVRDDIV